MASCYGVVDSDDEIMLPGCFKRSLGSDRRVVVLWQHDRSKPIGWTTKAEEDEKGLHVEAKLFMDTELGRHAFSFIKNGIDVGAIPGFSVGFRVTKGGDKWVEGRRCFTDCQLLEWSVVTFAACPGAGATEAKGATPFGDLPLADASRPWDAEAARLRIEKWAGGPGRDKISWAKYRKGFLLFDGEPDVVASYRFPFADVIDGKLMAVPKGLAAVVRADIPEEFKATVRSVISKYYTKMGKDSPFKSEAEGGSEMKVFEFKASDFASTLATSQALDDHYDLKWKADSALRKVIDDVCEDEDTAKDEKKPIIHKALDGHCDFMKSWWSKYLDITQPEDEDDKPEESELAAALDMIEKHGEIKLSAKVGAALSARTKSVLQKAMGLLKDSMGHSAQSKDLKTKALGHLSDLASGRYWNDVNRPNAAGAGASNGNGGGLSTNTGGVRNPVGGGKAEAEELDRIRKENEQLRQEVEQLKKAKENENEQKQLDDLVASLNTIVSPK
jgi:HK97 family phage prohead protease